MMQFLPLLLLAAASTTLGHVALMDPPARNVLWRTIPELPEHKDDDYLLCAQEGKKLCPPCGDDASDKKPLPHQAGGKWAYGIIARNYTVGETIPVTVKVTNSHGGHIEFKLCPNNNVKKPITQRCLDEFPLEVVGHRGGKVPVTAPYQETQEIHAQLVLPRGLSCKQCVLQMSQYAEQFKPSNIMFRNCADISILNPRSGGQSNKQRERYSDFPTQQSFSQYNDRPARITPRIVNPSGTFSRQSSQRALQFPQPEQQRFQENRRPQESDRFAGQNSRFFQQSPGSFGYEGRPRDQASVFSSHNGRQSQGFFNGPHPLF